jgi:hypothetical protein
LGGKPFFEELSALLGVFELGLLIVHRSDESLRAVGESRARLFGFDELLVEIGDLLRRLFDVFVERGDLRLQLLRIALPGA